jgi:hypothetical protein
VLRSSERGSIDRRIGEFHARHRSRRRYSSNQKISLSAN